MIQVMAEISSVSVGSGSFAKNTPPYLPYFVLIRVRCLFEGGVYF